MEVTTGIDQDMQAGPTASSIPWKCLLPVVGFGILIVIVILAIVVGSLVSKLGRATNVTAPFPMDQTETTPLTVTVTQPVLPPIEAALPTSETTPSTVVDPRDVTQWNMIRVLTTNRVSQLAFSPDGKTLAVATSSDSVTLLEMPSGEKKGTIGDTTNRRIYSVAFSPDSKILATAGSGWLNDLPAPEVTLWDATSGSLVKSLWGHKADVHRLAFSPDGSVLASGSGSIYYTKEGEVILWDIPGGNRRALISTYTSAISLAFSPDGNILAVGTGNEKVMLFDAHKGTQLKVMEGQKGAVVGVAFSSDGRTLVSVSVNNQIYFWDVNTGERLRMSSDPLLNPQFYCMALSPDGNVIATGSTDKIIRLWDFKTGNTLRLLVGEHITTVNSIAFSPDGSMLASSSDATGSEDGKIILWGVSK